ncbi:MAG: 1-acyl-sn-glycerol-3-phosphate acyltransferase [Ardenticatenaceae bacterium]|nr:1-acyl-sn-glycerol-3-phosphate acyltransferase [Anaerolineales bacterium]MCB8922755.1 1-acyl-sn-glycerol-3-phosphate acyltransferase [Ardenticatenaceae bacterium]
MRIIRALFRLTLTFLAIGLGTIIILLLAPVPLRVRGVRIAAWPVRGLARFIIPLYDVHLTCEEPEKFRQQTGFIFPNHLSYMDILLLASILPVRFVSKADLRSWPFIGWIAIAIDTVFVDRADKASRLEARQKLANNVSYYPPIVLFPEGGISNSGELQPFRYGAFEIAAQGSVSYLPCVFLYDRLDIIGWTDEPLMTALWRMATHSGPIHARLYALRPVQPTLEDDAQQLALEAHGAMNAVLKYAGREGDVLEPDI